MFHGRFIHFLFGAKEKLQNAPRFEMDFSVEFFHVQSESADFTCVNGSTIQVVLRKLL